MSRENSGHRERNTAPHEASQLSERDRAVVKLVGRFKQMTASQISAVLFADLASHTPLDRTLARLVEESYLARLPRPVGGDGGGSQQYVYQLGRRGWKLAGRLGEYWAPRAINPHTLAIADCFAALKRAEHVEKLDVIQFATELDCRQSSGGVILTPDACFEVGSRAKRLKFSYWLEVDRATEHARVIRDKCRRYWQAYQTWQEEHFPRVLFVVPDERRRQQIIRVVAEGPGEAQAVFRVSVRASFPQVVLTE